MNFYLKITTLVFITGFTCAFSVSADFSENLWEYKSRLALPASGEKYAAFELPSDFFPYLKPDLVDFRIVNEDGEVPFMIVAEKEVDVFASIPARMLNLSSLSGDTTSFVLDLGQVGVFHNRLVIQILSENFRRIVMVQGSDDKSSWRVLSSKGQIFDYTVRDIKPVAVRDTAVTYPDSTFRYLLVTILDQGESPLSIRGVEVSRRISAPAREILYSPGLEMSQDPSEKTTDLILDLGARGIPHRRGTVLTSSVNFSRAMAIYASDDKNDWQLLSNSYIYSIDTDKFRGSHLDFSYPESKRQYLKLSILNRDDKPIAVDDVKIFGVVRRVVFSLESGKEYYAYLGNQSAKRPQYDIEKILQYVDVALLDRASASPVEKNPAYNPPEAPKPPLIERSPYFLPVILGLVVAILAFLLLRVVTKSQTAGRG